MPWIIAQKIDLLTLHEIAIASAEPKLMPCLITVAPLLFATEFSGEDGCTTECDAGWFQSCWARADMGWESGLKRSCKLLQDIWIRIE
jgi:hypothetical protein